MMIVKLFCSIDIGSECFITVLNVELGLAHFVASFGAFKRKSFPWLLASLDQLAAMLQMKVTRV
jgi:hypothetical protein